MQRMNEQDLNLIIEGCYCYCYREPVILGHELEWVGESYDINACVDVCTKYHGGYKGCYDKIQNFDDKEQFCTEYLLRYLPNSIGFEIGDLI